MDPLREAIKHRRSHALDFHDPIGPEKNISDAKLGGQPGPTEDDKEQRGDLAPEANVQKSGEEEAAIHAKLNPEHEPLPRGQGADITGHEQSGTDPEIEELLAGHEPIGGPMGKAPKTLGAHVRAALQSRKG